jgi:putative peptidoglycan lipid II flippase
MAVGTALSRATGFLRTMALAAALGVSSTSDAYNAANTAPNMIFVLVAGGALSAAVVPLLVRSTEDRAEVASALLGATVAVGVVASAVVAVTAPWIMQLLTAGARGRPGHEAFGSLGTSWLRMFAPQVVLYAVSVMAVAIMTARRHLALGAVAPVATNALTIAAAVGFIAISEGRVDEPGDVTAAAQSLLGWGTTLAVAAMAGMQLFGAWRSEPGLRIAFAPAHPAVRELVRVGGWVSVYVVVNQLGLAAVTAIASSVQGGITAYQWGFMVMQLPYAIVAVSVLSAAVPAIAAAATRAERTARISRPLRLSLRWLLPAAIGLYAVAAPAARIVVDDAATGLVEAAITGFALSLLPFSVFQVLVRSSYALRERRLPATVNLLVNGVNVIAAAGTMAIADTSAERVLGLALSHASSYAVGCLAIGAAFHRRQIASLRDAGSDIVRVVVAAVPMAAMLLVLNAWVDAQTRTRTDALIGVLVAAAAAGSVYVVGLKVLGVEGALRPPAQVMSADQAEATARRPEPSLGYDTPS